MIKKQKNKIHTNCKNHTEYSSQFKFRLSHSINLTMLYVNMFVLFVFALCSLFERGIARDQPHNACPSYFRYEREGNGQWVGIITPHSNSQSITLSVQFSLQGQESAEAISPLEAYPDDETVKNNLIAGRSVDFKVRLYGSGALPKVTKIELNDQKLCESEGYSAPSTTITRIQKMHVATSSMTTTSQGQIPDLNNIVERFKLGNFFSNGQSSNNFDNFKTTFTTTNFGNNFGNNFDNNFSRNLFLKNLGTNNVDQDDQCGKEGLVPFMHGGEELERGRFPWLVAVYHDTDPDTSKVSLEHKCSGTLVSARSVLTAAHCVFGEDKDKIRVYLGRYNLGVHPEDGAFIKDLERIIVHPDYTRHIIPEADVAVLRMSSPTEFSTYVRPICIWTSSAFAGSDGGQQGSVAGWGVDENGNKPLRPKMVNVYTVSQAQCLRDMVGAKDFLTDRTLCAGNRLSHGPCLGDSGGGLMVQRSNRWTLRAIISLGSRAGDQCDLSQYVIYCDLAKHINWVRENI